ncbi:hypothetical protein E1193_00085 [Micromonospora sp. KC606]|uniref:DUF7710 domain-containing protein n=1 Tax=Micromonospora sp. KC606 TaxID=2530379 RepID=UPI0010433DED|nr:hypothetical protein [Micromonospora sp. KC606]TDC86112.1 hypothetical protein E1193_00085 [Micromonospora sp. KC606]
MASLQTSHQKRQISVDRPESTRRPRRVLLSQRLTRPMTSSEIRRSRSTPADSTRVRTLRQIRMPREQLAQQTPITQRHQLGLSSAVFDTPQAALAWAEQHRVTGILAEYSYGGAYDIAVSEGRLTPPKPHHGTADHVATFGPGFQHIQLTDGQPD